MVYSIQIYTKSIQVNMLLISFRRNHQTQAKYLKTLKTFSYRTSRQMKKSTVARVMFCCDLLFCSIKFIIFMKHYNKKIRKF